MVDVVSKGRAKVWELELDGGLTDRDVWETGVEV